MGLPGVPALSLSRKFISTFLLVYSTESIARSTLIGSSSLTVFAVSAAWFYRKFKLSNESALAAKQIDGRDGGGRSGQFQQMGSRLDTTKLLDENATGDPLKYLESWGAEKNKNNLLIITKICYRDTCFSIINRGFKVANENFYWTIEF